MIAEANTGNRQGTIYPGGNEARFLEMIFRGCGFMAFASFALQEAIWTSITTQYSYANG